MGKRSRSDARLEPEEHAEHPDTDTTTKKHKKKKDKSKRHESSSSTQSSHQSSESPYDTAQQPDTAIHSTDLNAQIAEQARVQIELDRKAAKLRTQQAEVDARAAELALREARLNEQELNDSSEAGNASRQLAEISARELRLAQRTAEYHSDRNKFLIESEVQHNEITTKRSELELAITEVFKRKIDHLMKQADMYKQAAEEYTRLKNLAVAAADRAKHDASTVYRSIHGDNRSFLSNDHPPNHADNRSLPVNDHPMPALERIQQPRPTAVSIRTAAATLSWLQQLDHHSLSCIPEILQAMRDHAHDTEILIAAIDLLYMMEISADADAPRIIEQGGLDVVLSALSRHANVDTLVLSSQRLLQTLAQASSANQQAILSATGKDYSTLSISENTCVSESSSSAVSESSPSDTVRLYIGGVHTSVTDDEVAQWVTQECSAKPISVDILNKSKNPKTFGFMQVAQSDVDACLALSGRKMGKRTITIQIASQKGSSQKAGGDNSKTTTTVVPDSSSSELKQQQATKTTSSDARAERVARRNSRRENC